MRYYINQTSNAVIRIYIPEMPSLELQYTSYINQLCQLPKLYTRTVPSGPDRRNRVPEPCAGRPSGQLQRHVKCPAHMLMMQSAENGLVSTLLELSRGCTVIICYLKVIINSTTIFNSFLPAEIMGKTFNRHNVPIFAVFPSYKYSVVRTPSRMVSCQMTCRRMPTDQV